MSDFKIVKLVDPITINNYVGDKNYVQSFTNVDTVIVTHGLGKYPALTVLNSASDEVIGEVTHDSVDQATVVFTGNFTGKVYCN